MVLCARGLTWSRELAETSLVARIARVPVFSEAARAGFQETASVNARNIGRIKAWKWVRDRESG
jgi:hypothetical protein